MSNSENANIPAASTEEPDESLRNGNQVCPYNASAINLAEISLLELANSSSAMFVVTAIASCASCHS